MKTTIRIACLLLGVKLSLAQSILNGSFEDNSLTNTFYYDFNSESFSSSIHNSNAFGESDTLMVCMKKGLAYEGDWSLIMYKQLKEDEFFNYKDDYVAMKLSEPLVQGEMYSISFYIKKYNITQFPNSVPSTSDYPASLIIGYADDSISSGVTFFETEIPNSSVDWQYQSAEFKCYHTNINYITIGIKEDQLCGPRYTCQLDFFNFSTITDIAQEEFSSSLYPNPTQGIVHVQHPTATEVVLHDLMGKEHYRKTLVPQQEHSLHLEHLPRGVYMLSLKNNKAVWEQKRLMKL